MGSCAAPEDKKAFLSEFVGRPVGGETKPPALCEVLLHLLRAAQLLALALVAPEPPEAQELAHVPGLRPPQGRPPPSEPILCHLADCRMRSEPLVCL